jgi:hypothetical protein
MKMNSTKVRLSEAIFDLRSDGITTARLIQRRLRCGAELELVNRYLSSRLLDVSASEQVTVLLEPKLPSGYPDILVLVWDRAAYERRAAHCEGLDSVSMRVLTLVQFSGEPTMSLVEYHLGRAGLRAANSLLEKGLLRSAARGTLSGAFEQLGLRRAVAIEAKIGKPHAAISQAIKNRTFATESYVLLDQVPRKPVTSWAFEVGVGVMALVGEDLKVVLKATSTPIQSSVMAWRLDEWIRARQLPNEFALCQ